MFAEFARPYRFLSATRNNMTLQYLYDFININKKRMRMFYFILFEIMFSFFGDRALAKLGSKEKKTKQNIDGGAGRIFDKDWCV